MIGEVDGGLFVLIDGEFQLRREDEKREEEELGFENLSIDSFDEESMPLIVIDWCCIEN